MRALDGDMPRPGVFGESQYMETCEGEGFERGRERLLDVLGRTRLPGDRCGDQAVVARDNQRKRR